MDNTYREIWEFYISDSGCVVKSFLVKGTLTQLQKYNQLIKQRTNNIHARKAALIQIDDNILNSLAHNLELIKVLSVDIRIYSDKKTTLDSEIKKYLPI